MDDIEMEKCRRTVTSYLNACMFHRCEICGQQYKLNVKLKHRNRGPLWYSPVSIDVHSSTLPDDSKKRMWCYRLHVIPFKTQGDKGQSLTLISYTAECIKVYTAWRPTKDGFTTQQFADVCAWSLISVLHSVPKILHNGNSSALVRVRHSAPPHNHRPPLPRTDAPLPQWCGTLSTVKGIEMGNRDWTHFSFWSLKWIQHSL